MAGSLKIHFSMQANPIVPPAPAPPPRYPFQMMCVFHPEEGYDFPIVRDVQAHCEITNIPFVARGYAPYEREEDMPLQRLPAFHISFRGSIQETRYFDTDPIHTLQRLVWAYEDELKSKERARLRRLERWEAFKEFVSLDRFKRKPALDRDASLKKLSAQNHTH